MMRKRFLAIVLVAFPLGAAHPADSTDAKLGSAGMLMLKGLPACMEEDFSSAYERCLPARADPEATAVTRHDALLARAKVMIYLRRSDEALQELESASTALPTSVGAPHLAARLAIGNFKDLNDDGSLIAAKTYIARAVALAPGDADVRATEAFIIQSMGTPEAAIAAYNRALALNPEQPFALQQRAFLHVARGDIDKALKDYGKAVAVSPDDVALRHARAELLLELGQPEAALQDLNVAIEQDKYAFLVYVMRAGVHQRLGNAAAALEDLDSLIYGPKGGMPFATGGDQLAGFFMQRALVHSDLGRTSEAAHDMLNAARLAGKQKLLRLQVYLRQNGLTVPVDGTASDTLKDAIETCFRQEQCRRGLGQPT